MQPYPGTKTCLVVIDGWGLSTPQSTRDNDAILAASTPTMSKLLAEAPNMALVAHGQAVGLPADLMGNSEVGHLNIGAGRVVYQDIVRIDLAIDSGSLETVNETLSNLFQSCVAGTRRIHFVGLVSDGGVHSHMRHLKALLSIARRKLQPHQVTAFVHAITDGRDTAPCSATQFLVDDLGQFLAMENFAALGTVCGRYYAMDRDQRQERTDMVYDALTEGKGQPVRPCDLAQVIEAHYRDGTTDEFFRPMIVDENGNIRPDDAVVFFNYRSDRMRQICQRFADSGYTRHICTMTQYKSEFPFPVLSPPQTMTNVLAEWLSVVGLRQCHVAETEKYAHVTFFFNGGREEPFSGEQRVLIASPKVATYDLQPEMSCEAVAVAMAEAVRSDSFDFVMGNLAPPDMVGHTGKFAETVAAVEATDCAIQLIYDACRERGVTLFITSDHGNAEKMCTKDGQPHTAHTCAPVPFICCDKGVRLQVERQDAALCDVAPTILAYMGLPIPAEMTGSSLL